ncbi:MAG TPA: glutathione S-transferase family protein [Haliea salexigens]|uniref:Glutathione S-transferase family protein n=1 Tax=Haliea salexigens TaxID=287487 RepID=A0A3C1KQQ5_9GAMM|nr:glutathione S-transferase [Haliea sp.]HAN29049.1 glutathione S-transferase family protein [Haliea salexigens]
MSEFILHHYALSPFSQKIRSMLGYTELAWQSALTREMPPRPELARMVGGYRKIPVAQQGADIFCDSRTIAAEIAVLAGKPALALENLDATAAAWAARADGELFFPCVLAGGTRALQRKVRAQMSWLDIGRFMLDRLAMGRKASVRMPGRSEAKVLVTEHLVAIEARLQADFLFGGEPNHADFSTYHGLWFLHDLGESPLLQEFPGVLEWMARMRAFGDGASTAVSAQSALQLAADTQPRAIPARLQRDAGVGARVSIAPQDYAQVPTEGVLVGVAPQRWIVAREEPGLGTLHLHFPQQGYTLTPL